MVAIRQAATVDTAVIPGLLRRLGYPCSGEDVAVRLGYWLGDPMSRTLLAERGGLVIGCLSLHGVPYLERTGGGPTGGAPGCW